MTLSPGEFIRRVLIHVLPKGLHRIRHYGLFASAGKAENLTRMRQLLDRPEPTLDLNGDGDDTTVSQDDDAIARPCPCCGGVMRIIESFEAGATPCHIVVPEGIDSS